MKTDFFTYKVALNTNQAVVNLEDTIFTSSKTHNFLLAGDHLKHALEVIVAGKNVKVLAAVPFGLLAELELSSASVMNIKKVADHHEPVLPPLNFFILEHRLDPNYVKLPAEEVLFVEFKELAELVAHK